MSPSPMSTGPTINRTIPFEFRELSIIYYLSSPFVLESSMEGEGPSSTASRGRAAEQENEGMRRAQRLVAGLPARFKPAARPESEADPRVVSIVRKWLELKETRGVVITQDLRTRHWYKSPDMMMSMLQKFGIDDRGTLFDVDMRGQRTAKEMRALWDAHEARRREERVRERRQERGVREGNVGGGSGQPKIAFTGSKQAAVQAALQAARAHAAEKDKSKRQKLE